MTTTKVLSNSETYEIILIGALIVLLAIILINLIDYAMKSNDKKKKSKSEKAKEAKRKNKDYVVSATKKSSNGELISHWHGYNTEKWIFSYEEAQEQKKKIAHRFHTVVVMEHKHWMMKKDYRIERPVESSK